QMEGVTPTNPGLALGHVMSDLIDIGAETLGRHQQIVGALLVGCRHALPPWEHRQGRPAKTGHPHANAASLEENFIQLLTAFVRMSSAPERTRHPRPWQYFASRQRCPAGRSDNPG